NLPFSFCGTLLSQRMPEACRHFNQLAEILYLTSSSMSPSFCSTDPKYRKVSFWTTTCLSRLTSPPSCLVALKSHIMYSVLVLLSLNPFDSNVRLHSSNFLLTLPYYRQLAPHHQQRTYTKGSHLVYPL